MLNKKGMTLIEVVIAIAILSIGATILYSGFATIAKMMIDSEAYTRNVNSQFSALNGKEENGAALAESESKIIINVDDKEIKIDGTLVTATSEVDTVGTLNLKKVQCKDIVEELEYEKFIKDYQGMVLRQVNLGNPGHRKQDFKAIAEKYGIEVDNKFGGYLSNDDMRTLYYLEFTQNTVHPKLDQAIIDKMDAIYVKEHEAVVKLVEMSSYNSLTQYQKIEYDMRPGFDKNGNPKVHYMHGYTCSAGSIPNIGDTTYDELDDYIFYYIDEIPNNATAWKTNLIYNNKDKHWYYKRFNANSGATNATIGISSAYQNKATAIFDLLKNPTEWVRID